jgi:hypothetical protein
MNLGDCKISQILGLERCLSLTDSQFHLLEFQYSQLLLFLSDFWRLVLVSFNNARDVMTVDQTTAYQGRTTSLLEIGKTYDTPTF